MIILGLEFGDFCIEVAEMAQMWSKSIIQEVKTIQLRTKARALASA